MQYHFANPEKLTRKMIHMVQKAYPEFDPERDFCLWLVFDLFDPAPTAMLHGFFQISDREGNTLSLLPEKGAPMLRSPYPNKAITQIGMKAGRKRVYGVPVVVPDYDTLQSIRSLTLEWILLHPDDIQPSAAFCHSGYQFSWPEEPVDQMHWFTLARKDTLKLDPDWYDIGYEGSRFRYEDGTVTVTDGTYTSFGLAKEEISRMTRQLCEDLQEPSSVYTEMLDRLRAQKPEEFSYLEPIHFTCRFQQKELAMEACPYADLLPEPCFGFEE